MAYIEWLDYIPDKKIITNRELKTALIDGVFTGSAFPSLSFWRRGITKQYLIDNYSSMNVDFSNPFLTAKTNNQVLAKRDVRPLYAAPSNYTATNQRPRFDDRVTTSVMMPDGRLLVGGFFTRYDDSNRKRIAALHTYSSNSSLQGYLDTESSDKIGTGFNGNVYKIIKLSTGKYLVAGDFTSYNENPANRIVRLNSDLSYDSSFNVGGSGFDRYVLTLAEDSSGKILVGGNFLSYNGTSCPRFIRLNSDGSIDTSVISNINTKFTSNAVATIKVLSSGAVLVGGNFTYEYYDVIHGNNVTVFSFVALNSDLTLFSSFTVNNPIIAGTVTKIDTQSTGNIIVSGNFGIPYSGTLFYKQLIRLNTSGYLDTSFIPSSGMIQFNDSINDFFINSSDEILAVGSFTTYNGVSPSNNFNGFVQFSPNGDTLRRLQQIIYTEVRYGFNLACFTICGNGSEYYVGGDFTTSSGFYTYNRISAILGYGSTFATSTSF